jgi:4-hydroxybenzoate polyprenyltransferase
MPETVQLKVLWALLRPQTYLLMCIYVLLGIVYGLAVQGNSLSTFIRTESTSLLAVLGALALWYIAGTALNDYADYEIDRINLKGDAQRPLVQGLLERKDLLHYALGASAGSFFLALLTGRLGIICLFSALLLLNAAYSLRPIQISRRGGFAPLLLPLGYIVLTVCSGVLLTKAPFKTSIVLLIAGMYLHFMARIILKDHRDVKGDAKAGKRTLVLQYGNAVVVQIALALFVSSALLLLTTVRTYAGTALGFAIALASGAVAALYYLMHEERWPYQKPLITIFGRFCSGMISVLIIGLVSGAAHMTLLQLKFTLVATTGLFFLSIFNILTLQRPKPAHMDR